MNKPKSPKNGVRAHKKGPRPKIKILKSGSVFRSPRGPTFQISWSYDLKPRRSEQTDKQTNRQTNRQCNIYSRLKKNTKYDTVILVDLHLQIYNFILFLLENTYFYTSIMTKYAIFYKYIYLSYLF